MALFGEKPVGLIVGANEAVRLGGTVSPEGTRESLGLKVAGDPLPVTDGLPKLDGAIVSFGLPTPLINVGANVVPLGLPPLEKVGPGVTPIGVKLLESDGTGVGPEASVDPVG